MAELDPAQIEVLTQLAIQRAVEAAVAVMQETRLFNGEQDIAQSVIGDLLSQGVKLDGDFAVMEMSDRVSALLGAVPLIDPEADAALHDLSASMAGEARDKAQQYGGYLHPYDVLDVVATEMGLQFPDVPTPFSRVQHVVFESLGLEPAADLLSVGLEALKLGPDAMARFADAMKRIGQ